MVIRPGFLATRFVFMAGIIGLLKPGRCLRPWNKSDSLDVGATVDPEQDSAHNQMLHGEQLRMSCRSHATSSRSGVHFAGAEWPSSAAGAIRPLPTGAKLNLAGRRLDRCFLGLLQSATPVGAIMEITKTTVGAGLRRIRVTGISPAGSPSAL